MYLEEGHCLYLRLADTILAGGGILIHSRFDNHKQRKSNWQIRADGHVGVARHPPAWRAGELVVVALLLSVYVCFHFMHRFPCLSSLCFLLRTFVLLDFTLLPLIPLPHCVVDVCCPRVSCFPFLPLDPSHLQITFSLFTLWPFNRLTCYGRTSTFPNKNM